MKNKIIQIGLLIGFTFGLVGFVQAQTASHYRINIPFDFTVGEKSFEAGDYSLNFGGLTGSRDTILIRSKKGKNAALLAVMPQETIGEVKNSVLIFNLIEDQYSLVEVRTPQVRAEIRKSKSKVKLSKNSKRVAVALKK